MGSNRAAYDEDLAARLLWQMKAIATKEVESLPLGSKQTFLSDVFSPASHDSEEESSGGSCGRSRTVSVESVEMLTSHSPFKLSMLSSPGDGSRSVYTEDGVEHHDWSNRSGSPSSGPPVLPSLQAPKLATGHRYGKRKRESFVGQSTKAGTVRATLKKKFSWKQYPELEGYLLDNQEEYFEYSSRNYTAEQRKYNNDLTRGLLDLAASEGYAFEDFTFSMVRDRIRCYYKSHSQSAKKKRKR
mmetsp:Transcript_80151/g.120470  ORF Transcript_80151/g.120470 Transcript_80151/m.120470 type:complete len:243 (+) Transcript_80151:253-981(+)|eukprot:CAMPEP_0117041726 /NCGR_PEP_ID=MMETSP0472-20121206/29113_1 /TAXON_ID=693140 ORGANISM="Tiarina fusus, Strain LIS" /NCGR_SAMPLE_ID=MMETSP0472 /ASSEMBLY_ACC=CAM_ASM_000603 /LENGTH=242 /DNA_ID=CAMNT_0004752797 /DNA_START=238 /DNA_END=966 /DNA_ORIENTATION=+